ncbi:hypothetical protein ARMSODRAFT_1019648 [Armillaria solidipes]|uniref:Uncharacterized protein n=1 Tax=Armillaria solidipes TaxID=1076256 RepID=A0A2H3BNH0_9AGAR|nr:hypothetical protein ARMSODRAFT_1019648 [Armillaria solidipes]
MAPESMQIARFKAALALLRSRCKNGVYLPTIPSVLPTLKDGNPDFDAILVIDKENLRFLEGVMPLFDNKERFMQAYQEEPSLLREGAFGARRDCQNRKLLLEVPHGSKAPENSTFPGRATGWIHSDREEKQAAAAANAQAVAASFAPKPAAPTPLPKIKKTPKTIKSKATVGLDTDPETIIIDEDVKMKAAEESMVVDLDSDESDSMSVNEDLPAKGAPRGRATRKRRGRVSKRAATHSPAPVARTTDPAQCDSCGKESHGLSLCTTVIALPYCDVPGLTKSDPMYRKAIDVLEKQDRILAERSNKRIRADVALMARGGDLGDNQLVFPIAAWSNQFQLQSKYESVQDALKLLSAEHVRDGTLASFQLHKRRLDAELELLVHRLEATVVAYKFCDKQLTLVGAEIGRILCPDTSGEIRI